ncbi:L-threonate dehydrogenase [Rhodovastum atsumiense]|uniref:NAD(P)-dependent oxidoreductase n=1 Tax=Rhodovastum atsumiense TaxID=504468 RepID=UPI001EF02A45|nr:NAD(P)-dependent oxidoreductase [Rhodovastum atsumiense]CAH2604826.1 L-threonate dehydrogenase [Rhodovastum atsumiense]
MTGAPRTVGFVGLGAMGLPMAQALLAGGFTVHGWDLRADSREALAASGGLPAESAAAAATGADALVLMVVNAAQAETVLFDEGALAALPPQGIVVLMATCPPAAVVAIAERVQASGRGFVDAPVSGGVAGARAAKLTIMAAGSDDSVAAVRPLFAALGDRIFHVGPTPGQGATVKTANQLLCGVHIAVAAEAFALAEKIGVDRGLLLEVMSGSSAASWMLRDRGPRMLQEAPEVTSAIDIFVKDLGIVLQAGRDARAALPLTAAAHQLFLASSGRGDGTADDSQVIRSYRVLNGT